MSITINSKSYETFAAAREALDELEREEEKEWVQIDGYPSYRITRDGAKWQHARTATTITPFTQAVFDTGLRVGQEQAAELAEAVLAMPWFMSISGSVTGEWEAYRDRILSLARAIGGAQ